MVNYVVAIPSYKRAEAISEKTLKTLKEGGVPKFRIYIFVANKAEAAMYEEAIDPQLYNEIIVGKLGLINQRKFINKWFKEGQYIVSLDDDVEELQIMNHNTGKLVKFKHVAKLFEEAYHLLKKEGLYLWGIYPVRNYFFMKQTITTDLRFIVGVLFGYINRDTKKLDLKMDAKEDYDRTIKYYKLDGGVLRINYICVKTKFNSEGGLGTSREKMNALGANYLKQTYPEIITIFHRANGITEVKLSKEPRFYPTKN
jgi:hypothetical protein